MTASERAMYSIEALLAGSNAGRRDDLVLRDIQEVFGRYKRDRAVEDAK